MADQDAFPHFRRLPAELRVAIIKFTLDEDIEGRDRNLTLGLQISDTYEGASQADRDNFRAETQRRIQLPKLPAVYHVNGMFRAEANRVRPLLQILEVGFGTLDPRGAMVVFDPARDTFEIKLQDDRLFGCDDHTPIYVFELMNKKIMASVQRMRVLCGGWIYNECYLELYGAVYDPRFVALETFGVVVLPEPCPRALRNGHRVVPCNKCTTVKITMKLKECGDTDICATRHHGTFHEARSWIHSPDAAETKNLKEKRKLQEPARK
ncbi:hypothetical protein EJ02DRAFT_423704 [Clathrospora elynae]|uniref:2EXR domain-containing protein n=1 Tax=Clathrospora elynae TaxID=706981 RepID=A0A6A5SQ63_9PLEO|nr:hypothetical protein EJ02DRAFT_423704 [Clathrospora elynae]